MTKDEKDNIVFENNFSFDEKVSRCFTDMISRSIPDYNTLRKLVFSLGKNFIKPNTTILDVGCSNGIDVISFIKHFNNENNFVLIDNSVNMIKEAEYHIKEILKIKENISFYIRDLTKDNLFDISNVSLCLCLFLLQFIPLSERQKVLKNIYNTMNKGSVIIVAEKTLLHSEEIQDLFTKEYYNIKKENGYTTEQILSKRKALKGIMFPVFEETTKQMLEDCGFTKINTFWKCLGFVAFIAIK